MRGRLPPSQRPIKENAEEYSLRTTTFNCEEKVFTNTDGKFIRRTMKNIRAVEDVKNDAVKRAAKQRKPHTPSTSIFNNEDTLKSILKRF